MALVVVSGFTRVLERDLARPFPAEEEAGVLSKSLSLSPSSSSSSESRVALLDFEEPFLLLLPLVLALGLSSSSSLLMLTETMLESAPLVPSSDTSWTSEESESKSSRTGIEKRAK